MNKSEPIEYAPIPALGKGHCALSIHPPGSWFDNVGYMVFVGGSGRGERKTLAEAEQFLMECAVEECSRAIEDAGKRAEHYVMQRRLLLNAGLRPAGSPETT